MWDFVRNPLLNALPVFITHDGGKLPISILITRAHKQNIKS